MSEPTLVERLRFDKRHGANHVATCLEAADRIDELKDELLRESKLSLKQYKQVQDLLNEKTQLNAVLDNVLALISLDTPYIQTAICQIEDARNRGKQG
jgi:hypothetical protein